MLAQIAPLGNLWMAMSSQEHAPLPPALQNPDKGIKTQTQRVMITNIPHAVAGKNFSKGRAVAKFSKAKLCEDPLSIPRLLLHGCLEPWDIQTST